MAKLSDQFRGLPMKDLIGGPLQAACDAQVLLAQASADFIHSVGMDQNDDKSLPLKVKTVDFSFDRPTQAGDGSRETVNLQVPLLAIVNTPSLSVKEVNIDFTMEVHETQKDVSSSEKKGSFSADMSYGFGMFSAKVHVQGSVVSKSEHTRETDNSAKYDVKVIARDDGMPEGLRKVLDMLNTAIAPTSVTSGST